MKYRKLLCAALCALMLLVSGATALAKAPSPSEAFYYLDQANVLSEATEGEIFFSNQLLDKACGAQVVVVTVKNTGGASTDDYAYDLFNQWGIGDKKEQNGFLLLLSIEDDDYYALCGSNLQPKFTSSAIKEYYDRYLETDFAAKRYDAGVKKFFEAVFARVADTYNAKATTAQGIAAYKAWAAEANAAPLSAHSGGGSMANRRGEEEGDGFGMVLIILIVLLVIVLALRSGRRRRVYGSGVNVTPIIFSSRRTPPPPPPMAGPGGYHGANTPGPGGYRGTPTAGAGGYRGTTGSNRSSDWLQRGVMSGLFRSMGGSSWSSGGSSRSSRSSGGSRSSGFGSARGGGGGTRGGGAGRGRH